MTGSGENCNPNLTSRVVGIIGKEIDHPPRADLPRVAVSEAKQMENNELSVLTPEEVWARWHINRESLGRIVVRYKIPAEVRLDSFGQRFNGPFGPHVEILRTDIQRSIRNIIKPTCPPIYLFPIS